MSAVDRLLKSRLIGIVRLDDLEVAVACATCAIEAGLNVIEVTFTLTSAARAIERLRRDHPEALIGAGTVRSGSELEHAAAAGAQFLVAPGLNPELVEAARMRGLPMLPGVFTASEVDAALRCGVEVLKLFPVAVAMGSSLFPAGRIMSDGPDVVTPLVAEALAAVGSADRARKGDHR